MTPAVVKNITVLNYKAFDIATLPLNRITVLLGANSVGKSSLIQLLLLLNQTVDASIKSYKSALKLYGKSINLGEAINLFRNRKDKPLTVEFDIQSEQLASFLKSDLFNEYIDTFNNLPLFVPIKGFNELANIKIESYQNFKKYIDIIVNVLSGAKIKDEIYSRITRMISTRNFIFPTLDETTYREFLNGYLFLEKLAKKIKNSNFKISFDIRHINNKLRTTGIRIEHNLENIITLNEASATTLSATSSIDDIGNSDTKVLYNYFDFERTIFSFYDSFKNDKDLPLETVGVKSSILIKIIKRFQQDLRMSFENGIINYVSPLRAHPKRYYMLDKAKVNYSLDTLDGDAIAEVLKENAEIRKSVNEWLSHFGITVSVKEFKEVIHQLRVKENNLELDITDVGFGISQVLPVILSGFLSSENSYIIIEQPEIHLHPKMQADLADLFIAIVKKSPHKKLIIETHSEYILKRLRRRMSEFSKGLETSISPSDVSICKIDPQDGVRGAVLTKIPIEDKGYFDWPIEFYGGELYEDTAQFIRNQSQK